MDTLDYYKSVLHEQKRADKNAKPNYKANLQIERDRLEAAHADYIGEVCGCAECQG